MEVNHCLEGKSAKASMVEYIYQVKSKFEHKFQSAELAADTVINRTELEIRIT